MRFGVENVKSVKAIEAIFDTDFYSAETEYKNRGILDLTDFKSEFTSLLSLTGRGLNAAAPFPSLCGNPIRSIGWGRRNF